MCQSQIEMKPSSSWKWMVIIRRKLLIEKEMKLKHYQALNLNNVCISILLKYTFMRQKSQKSKHLSL